MYHFAIKTSTSEPVLKHRGPDMRAANMRDMTRISKKPKPAPKTAAFSEITPDYVDQFVQKMDALIQE